ncbi:helix-turn-helix transcriptional regulator [Moraxella nonliquefaciens]|uniref:XRE family transcriptional regulator n=1 Tax=Moraxella nonliquefaciens TaxID=478 RepID=UPI001EF6A568|nr:helix-turn-helix transcriptional regulator [Moraxella nonliquefaciens]MCG7412591.1 helix-turn-helix transcriptional regulator [Moraxella nonliquefaciens]
MNTLAERLKFAREKINLTQQEVADRAGMSQPTYYKIESGKSQRTTYLNELANVLKVTPNWLATGQGEMTALQSNISPNFEPVSDWDDGTPLEADEVPIPFYKDFGVACGHGSDGVAYENEKRRLRISRATIDRIGSYKDKIMATLADGDSMSPTINDGDTIWVDMSKETIKDGKIFVFEYGGLFMCKRLYRLPNNGLRVVSDNADVYPEWEITGEEREQNGFKLIGWVWHWSVMERW